MGELKCHECGAEFGTSAMVCKKCGVKTKRPAALWERLILAFAFLAFLAPFVPWHLVIEQETAQETVAEDKAAVTDADKKPDEQGEARPE